MKAYPCSYAEKCFFSFCERPSLGVFSTLQLGPKTFSKYSRRNENKDCIFQKKKKCLFWIFNSKAVYISMFFSSSVHKASASLSWLYRIYAGVQTTLQNSRRVPWGEERNCFTGRKKVSNFRKVFTAVYSPCKILF